MSYQVLARRWRPQSFEEVSGQRHVTTALRNAILHERLPHALLLAGPRGTGKTSIARILARSLNCDEGPTEKPCGKCSSCIEIANSTSLDVQEIDAASNTGVDNVREIRDNVRYAAAKGKYRIYIIDEVHMLSQQAFNALLKTLEEPPPHSLFIFATTDPQKIPATVLSRVQRFDLKRLGARDMLDRLRQIASADEISIPDSVLHALVREGDGSLRDAQTLLDRLLSVFGKAIEEEGAFEVLDLVERKIIEDIVDPVLAGDPRAALAAVRRALDSGVDASRLAAEILTELRNLLVARLVDQPGDLIEAAPAEVAELQRRAEPHDAETLQRLFRVLLTRIQELAFAPRPEQALEMAAVRLATLPEAEALGALIRRLDALDGTPPPRAGGPSGGGAPSTGGAKPGASGGRRRAAPGPESAASEPRAPTGAEQQPRARPEPDARTRPEPQGRTRRQREAQMRREARDHPAVQQAIAALDAELHEVRVPRDGTNEEVT